VGGIWPGLVETEMGGGHPDGKIGKNSQLTYSWEMTGWEGVPVIWAPAMCAHARCRDGRGCYGMGWVLALALHSGLRGVGKEKRNYELNSGQKIVPNN